MNRPPNDTELLDWLQKQSKKYGYGWLVTDSPTNRDIKLEALSVGTKPSVRQAIRDAMKQSNVDPR